MRGWSRSRNRSLVSETYTELRKRLEQEETAPPPPPETQPLDKLELDTGGIIFGGGVPVGGYSRLSVFANGAFSFNGHFHDFGTPPYDVALVWVLKSSTGTAFTFSHKGRRSWNLRRRIAKR